MYGGLLERFLAHIHLTLACMKHVGVAQNPLFRCQQEAGPADPVDREGGDRMTRTLWGLGLMLVYALSACGHQLATNSLPTVRTIQILNAVTPDRLYAKPGEEIRWQNLRQNPVRVGFLTMRILDELTCQKGVANFWGGVNDLVTIPPGGTISLCFKRAGVLQYNVWFDPDNPRGAISPMAAVDVETGG
jgi:hypothetical protein